MYIHICRASDRAQQAWVSCPSYLRYCICIKHTLARSLTHTPHTPCPLLSLTPHMLSHIYAAESVSEAVVCVCERETQKMRVCECECHTYESCHTYEWVMSHIWMSHVTHMHESCHTYAWVTSHIWMTEKMRVCECECHTYELCHTHEWVMSHTWVSHVTHMSESCHTYAWVTSHIRMTEKMRVCECEWVYTYRYKYVCSYVENTYIQNKSTTILGIPWHKQMHSRDSINNSINKCILGIP